MKKLKKAVLLTALCAAALALSGCGKASADGKTHLTFQIWDVAVLPACPDPASGDGRATISNGLCYAASPKNKNLEIVKDVLKSLIIPLWNAYSFFVTYANIDGYEPSQTSYDKLSNPLDRWIISDLNKLIKDVTEAMDTYQVDNACSALVAFIDDLNNWYIRRSRRRFWKSENDGDKKAAYDTLYRVLVTFVKIAAPMVPFITEEIYLNLRTDDMPESVHLEDYPVYSAAERDERLEKEMSLTMKAIAMGRALRSTSNLKIRQPLKEFFIVDRSDEERSILKDNSDIISEELNVKQVSISSDEGALVTYSAKANFKVLGAKLGKNMKEVAAMIQSLSSDEIASILDGKSISIKYSSGEIEISEGDLVVQRSEKEHVKVLNEGSLTVGYDTEITEELLLEGIARDLVRAVQTERKESGLEVADHINLTIYGSEKVSQAVSAFGDYISQETLASSLVFAENDGKETEAGDEKASIKVVKA